MSYPKMKSENYSNIGGINQKVSVYSLGDREVLDLRNFDFQEPGAWTPRWGCSNVIVSGSLTIGGSQIISNIWQAFKIGNIYNPAGASLPNNDAKNRILVGFNSGIYKFVGSVSGGLANFSYATFLYGNTGPFNWNATSFGEQNYFTGGAAFGFMPMFKYRPQTFQKSATSSIPNEDDPALFGMARPPLGVSFGLAATTCGS